MFLRYSVKCRQAYLNNDYRYNKGKNKLTTSDSIMNCINRLLRPPPTIFLTLTSLARRLAFCRGKIYIIDTGSYKQQQAKQAENIAGLLIAVRHIR